MVKASRTVFIKCSADTKLSIETKTNKNTPLPPPISAQKFNKEGRFNADAVMSRDADGGIVSRFKDASWDFHGLRNSTSISSSMYFNYNEGLANEAKTIIKLIMLTPIRPRPTINRHIRTYYVIKRITEYCCAEKITLKSLFNTKGGVGFVKLIDDTLPYFAMQLVRVSQYLHFMHKEVGFDHGYKPLGRDVQLRLNKIWRVYTNSIQQTPVIPSRILKKIYFDTIFEYEALLPILNELFEMQRLIDSHPMVGGSLANQKHKCNKLCGTSYNKLDKKYPTNYELGSQFPLTRDFLNKKFGRRGIYNQPDSYDFQVLYGRDDVLKAIRYVQRVCQDMLIMFTGMRPTEARLLPYFGNEKTVVDGVEYWLIYGFGIKKQSNTLPFEMWVTNEFGYRAFQTTKRIADYFYTLNQKVPLKTMPDTDITPELSPLFLGINGEAPKSEGRKKKTPALGNLYPITEDDLNELKMIDPHRKWDGESKFAIGEPFPVELRMFRRSIAFFASASGVRLADLKNQLHHLFPSQTFYYSKGSGRANPFLKNKDSFASYFNQVKHEAEAFSFINEVINYDGKLFGSSAAYEERNKNYYDTIRNEERAITIKRFNRGELAYVETHVGGCKTIAPCKYRALGSVTSCLSCNDADINPEKLASAIKDQKQLVDSLNPDRLEFRTEIYELITILDFAIKNIVNAMESLDRRKKEYKQFSRWRKEFNRMKKKYSKKIDEQGRVA